MLSRYDTRRKRGYQDYHGYHLTGTTWGAMSARRVQALPSKKWFKRHFGPELDLMWTWSDVFVEGAKGPSEDKYRVSYWLGLVDLVRFELTTSSMPFNVY